MFDTILDQLPLNNMYLLMNLQLAYEVIYSVDVNKIESVYEGFPTIFFCYNHLQCFFYYSKYLFGLSIFQVNLNIIL